MGENVPHGLHLGHESATCTIKSVIFGQNKKKNKTPEAPENIFEPYMKVTQPNNLFKCIYLYVEVWFFNFAVLVVQANPFLGFIIHSYLNEGDSSLVTS